MIRAAAASAGLHGLVVLLVAWFLAVLPSIERLLPEVVAREEVEKEAEKAVEGAPEKEAPAATMEASSSDDDDEGGGAMPGPPGPPDPAE